LQVGVERSPREDLLAEFEVVAQQRNLRERCCVGDSDGVEGVEMTERYQL
jgi:hypothetical protein